MPHTRCLQRLEVGSAATSEAAAAVERDRATEYLHGLMRRAAEPEVGGFKVVRFSHPLLSAIKFGHQRAVTTSFSHIYVIPTSIG